MLYRHQLVRGRQARCADLLFEDRLAESLRANVDDRLPVASLGRVEGGDGIVEGRDVADVRPQSSVPHPLDDLIQLGAIGLDNEVDRQAAGGPYLGRPDDSHQCSPGPDQACGPLRDVAANDVKNQVDAAHLFEGVVAEVDELLTGPADPRSTSGNQPTLPSSSPIIHSLTELRSSSNLHSTCRFGLAHGASLAAPPRTRTVRSASRDEPTPLHANSVHGGCFGGAGRASGAGSAVRA